MIYNNILETIGDTPLVFLNKLNKNLYGKIAVKIEGRNPGGSIKDRPAFNMIETALNEKKIDANTHIVEPTSGNTGIGLAMICAVKNLKLTIIMPDHVSKERIAILKAYGANVILTKGEKRIKGAIEKAEEILKSEKNVFIPSQFDNKNNPDSHILTAKEIIKQTGGKIDIFVSAFGTGGTFTGISKYLKKVNSKIKTIVVEPAMSPVLSAKTSGLHNIQGIGPNFIPENLDTSLIDDIISVSDSDAFEISKKMAKIEGIFCGISSGANVFAAIKIAERIENKDKLIITILPDNGDRYLSVENFIN
ncbi:MAG: cysteine synthase A [Bacteroidetes bacterium]|nr:MAG: cysteine synthase A [Bacteroidota bacterium]